MQSCHLTGLESVLYNANQNIHTWKIATGDRMVRVQNMATIGVTVGNTQ